MPNIPYVPIDISEPSEVVTAIRRRRGGTLLNLDRMLLHSPPLAEGWNGLLGAVRSHLSLSPRLRELVICAVGSLNDAPYEVIQHARPFLEAGGTSAQLKALDDVPRAAQDVVLFDACERSALCLAVAMTRDVRVDSEVFSAVRQSLGNDRQMIELVGVAATYNMVSRFLVALGVEPE
jgi:alkylhydroperoxidase family enzyme